MPVTGVVRIWQFVNVLKNRVQARTAANFKLRIALLLAFSVANVVLGGLIYGWLMPGESWGTSLFTVYAVLFSIPGADITNAPTPFATFLLNLIFVFGLLVFATILAMISEEVNSVLLAARSGRSPLEMTGHILLLNWNKQVSFILEQLEHIAVCGRGRGHPFADRPLVILADKNKEDMDRLVLGFMRHHGLEVHTRTGKPYIVDHLRRVSASDAAAVLVLHPDTDETAGSGGTDCISGSSSSSGASALKTQTILALAPLLVGKKAAVVVQVPECRIGSNSLTPSCCPLDVLDEVLTARGHSTHLLELPVSRIVNSLAVQTALQPQVGTIYHQLLQQGSGPEITFIHIPPALFEQKSKQSKSNVERSDLSSTAASSGFTDDLPSRSSSSFRENLICSSSSFLGSITTGSLFNRPSAAAAAAAAAASSSNSVAAARLAAAAPEAASAEASAAVDVTVVYEDVRARYSSDMLVIGFYRRHNHHLVLNPDEHDVLGPGDVLVALTRHKGHRSVCTHFWRRVAHAWQQLLLTLWHSSSGGGSSTSAGTGTGQDKKYDPAAAAAVVHQQPVSSGRSGMKTEICTAGGPPAAAAADTLATSDRELQPLLEAECTAATPQQQQQQQQFILEDTSTPQIAKPSSSSSSRSRDNALLLKLNALRHHLAHRSHHQHAADQAASGSSSSAGAAAGLKTAWRFGSSKIKQQHHKTSAKQRLGRSKDSSHDQSSLAAPAAPAAAAAAKGHPGSSSQQQQQQQRHGKTKTMHRPLDILVVGYTATEAAEELLPHFLDFAPPGSVITISVHHDPGSSSSTSSGSSSNLKAESILDRIGQGGDHMTSSSSSGSVDHAAAAAAGSSAGGHSFLPAGWKCEGVLEEVEERERDTPLLHKITYKFVPVRHPTSCEGLAAAGLMTADAVLITAAAAARGSSNEADAHVLGTLVEIQHLLLKQQSQAVLSVTNTVTNIDTDKITADNNRTSDSVSGSAHNTASNMLQHKLTSFADRAAQMRKASMKRRGVISKLAHNAVAAAAASDLEQQQQEQREEHNPDRHPSDPPTASLHHPQQQQQRKRPHIVACVSTTAAKAVADAFFGGSGTAAAAAGSSVSSCLFSYELIVPGEVESAVLVQVAQQPLYIKVILELLGTSEGCELYTLEPHSFGVSTGEVLSFSEVQEVGRLLHKTVIGVITGGQVVLVPGSDWKWVVREGDKIAAIAVSW